MTQNLNILSPHPRLLVRWFVQYNPMFTASALCVLGGVLMISKTMGSGADVALTAVLELYQWLVIAVAALLYRRLLERRPAAILGVIALIFLMDPTLQLGALAATQQYAATIACVVLFALKWRALEWAFRLRLSSSARILPPLVYALVAATPNARVLGVDDTTLPAALAVIVFVVGVIASFSKLRVESRQALGQVGQIMFPRLQRAAVVIGVVGAAYQVWNALFQLGPTAMLPALGALAFVVVATVKHESPIWLFAPVGLALIGIGKLGLLVGLPLLSVALLIAARNKEPRIFVGGVMAAVAAVALPIPIDVTPGLITVALAATLALAFVLYRRHAWSAIPALIALHAPGAMHLGATMQNGQIGLALLGSGFVLLPLGVILHRKLSRVLAADELAREEASKDAPSTSAGIGTSAV